MGQLAFPDSSGVTAAGPFAMVSTREVSWKVAMVIVECRCPQLKSLTAASRAGIGTRWITQVRTRPSWCLRPIIRACRPSGVMSRVSRGRARIALTSSRRLRWVSMVAARRTTISVYSRAAARAASMSSAACELIGAPPSYPCSRIGCDGRRSGGSAGIAGVVEVLHSGATLCPGGLWCRRAGSTRMRSSAGAARIRSASGPASAPVGLLAPVSRLGADPDRARW